jgi:hypothetical protein
MRLPMQSAPVSRVPGPAGRAGGSGVEASGWFEDLLPIAQTVGPPLISALGSLI